MQRNFSYTLLITWILFSFSCKTIFATTSSKDQKTAINNRIYTADYLPINTLFSTKYFLENETLADNTKLSIIIYQTLVFTSVEMDLNYKNDSNLEICRLYLQQKQKYIL